MWKKYHLGIIFIINLAKLRIPEASEKCSEPISSTYGYYLSGHVITTRASSNLSECAIMCLHEFRCKSTNFLMQDKSCDLNGVDRHTHPEDYGPMEGSVYIDTTERHRKEGGFRSCEEIHQYFPQAESGYYWIKIGNKDAQLYCDMENHGGGWTLVVSVSSKSNDHLQRSPNKCVNSILCVAFVDNNIKARKLGDGDIHKLAQSEGTFRVDVLDTQVTIFYQIPSGPENFNSSCNDGDCPRIIISDSYPHQWETNPCTTIDVGYRIARSKCHRVFDGHDDNECGSVWQSSSYKSGKRALYGLPCLGHPYDSLGLFMNSDGMLYVK